MIDLFTSPQVWLVISSLAYFMMNGAQLFETFVVIPKWTASSPESLGLLKGKYGLELKTFWILFHSIHELIFILAIVFCWKWDPVRNWLILLFLIHFAVRIWTLLYFAPNIIEFQKIANRTGEITGLPARIRLWKNMNYIRVGIFIAISFAQALLCLKMIPGSIKQ